MESNKITKMKSGPERSNQQAAVVLLQVKKERWAFITSEGEMTK